MKRTVLALSLAASAISPAMAQTADDNTPTFTGPHVGVSVGWNRGTDKKVLPGVEHANRSGVAVRGNVGYDLPIGNSAIIGGEFGIGSGGRDITTTQGSSRYVTHPGLTLDATARVGVKPVDKLLLFAKGGWGFQRVQTRLATLGGTSVEKHGEHGFLWGAGAEYAVSKNVALRADFDRVSFNDHYKRTRLMAGINFRF